MKQLLLEHILFPSKRINKSALLNCVKGKTVLITGASYGIGESTARKLATQGVTLILVARSKEKLQKIKEELQNKGAKVYLFCCDLYDIEQTDILISDIKKENLTIDIFINNAGKSICRSIEDSLDRFHDFTRTMSINYYSPIKIILALLPVLKQRKGHIINISAINVLFAPAPKWAAYQASKAAMDNWVRSALPELKAMGIGMTCIYFPLVKTRMILPTEAYRNAPAMQPGQAAIIICKAIIKRNNRWKPWWVIFLQLASVILRNQWERACVYHINKKRK